jgi:hypothetical protein
MIDLRWFQLQGATPLGHLALCELDVEDRNLGVERCFRFQHAREGTRTPKDFSTRS